MKQTSLGGFIRSLRQQKGMTQMALASQLHVTDKAVSKWERELSFPDIQLFPKLAEVLDVTVGDLISKAGDCEVPSGLLKQYEISSDIRAPLHIIIGCTDLLKAYRDDDEKFRCYLDTIRVSGEHLLSVLSSGRCCNEQEGSECQDGPSIEELLKEQFIWHKDATEGFDFTGRRILVADDISVNRDIIREILSHTGAEMDSAEDGCECVALVENNPPGYYDIILMDLMMPNMNGIEAARQIRTLAEDAKANIPIIAITANVDSKDKDAAFEAGMSAFSEKPLVTEKLLSTIEELLS